MSFIVNIYMDDTHILKQLICLLSTISILLQGAPV